MKMCARCKKRPAVVFISRMEGDQTINEGICLRCAKEMGLKPVDDIMEKMGISADDLDRMDMEMQGLMETMAEEDSDDDSQGKTPPIDFNKLFGSLMRDQSSSAQGSDKEPEKKEKNKKKEEKNKKFLSMYCENLTDKAKAGKLDNIVGRERELARVMQILCRRQKNNPCLIGEPGVGKTAIAEALASKIASGDVPYKLKNKEVHLLDLTSLVAGTQFRGQFETRIKGLIEEVKSLGNIILVIDEVHTIVGAGDAEGGMNAANILKPALSRGEIQVIGATTLAEYRKYIEKDAALERRFQPIIVDEPSVESTVQILLGIKKYYENFHGIAIPDGVIRRAVVLSERYITDRFLPDKAIDLLDEACSYQALNSPCINELADWEEKALVTSHMQEELESHTPEQDAVEEHYKQLADLKQRSIVEQTQIAKLREEKEKVKLTLESLAAVIEIWTGIPASNITEMEYERIEKLSDRIRAHIIGQDEAVDAVVRAIKRSRAGISYKRKPVSFIFAGPTGVGKTELVKTLASDLFSSPETLIRLDMTEFMEKHSVSRIIGAPPGYVGYDDAGQLTEKIRRKPYSVVLFDEIEKAHPDVLNVLLQILDDGRITDAQGRTVNFENTVIVMTTNAGSTMASAPLGFGMTALEQSKEKTMRALEEFLRPEFLNRVDEIITFRALDKDNFNEIAKIMIDQLREVLSEHGVKLHYTNAAISVIAENSFSAKYGARNMRRYIQKHVEDVIAAEIIGSYDNAISMITLDGDVDSKKLSIRCI
ncbi:MAG: ATP-dependent Clp protease ATP-binding subunit [Ruminococcaceae bacterium]|nr:ATP-dependent Clp protease ATP-binding subunit [Oscillospiraceae bacterium]